jgi:phosphohistidine phosphatase SixA
MLRRSFISLCTLLAAPAVAEDEPDSDALWRRLQAGGHVVLMRHAATAPGIGDPPGFSLNDCASQRNLSRSGRQDAADIGAAFRRRAVPVAQVLSSRWCRCLDTARLAFGRGDPAQMIDSMFTEDAATSRRKVDQVKAYLRAYKEVGNLVFVTHDVNIRALVGRYLSQGEMVVAVANPDGSLRVAGVLKLADVR